MFFNIQDLTKEKLQELIDNQVFENKELEYKDYSFTNGKIDEKNKDKFMKEIVSFANTNGGFIIIGMKEDNNRLPIEITGAGFPLTQYDNWLSSFRQLVLSRIRPHLHGIECKPVELTNGTIAIVIHVPKSYARPHSFWDGNKDEFYMRYANGITYMDIDDLRKQFLHLGYMQSQIQQFRKDRISMILANECVGDLGAKAKLVFHIIPKWSFELGNTIDLKIVDHNRSFLPISGDGWSYRYNADGFCIYSVDSSTRKIETYTQIFHNGIIEAVEIRLVSGYQPNQVYAWNETQKAVIQAAYRYRDVLLELNVPKPWHIYATILNAKGYYTQADGWSGTSAPLDRMIIQSLDGILDDGDSMDSALRPVFNSLSNAFGFKSSVCFDQNGNIQSSYLK
ncbi:hypothetical protein SATMO3_35190 [Sporomusa aerivorans]